jgi:hypothetical protein
MTAADTIRSQLGMAPLPPASVSESAAWRQFIQTTLNLKFDLTTGWFWIRVADRLQLVPITEVQLLALLCRTIGAEPASKLSLSQLKQLVGELKISAAEANSDAVQDLRQFVQARVVRQPGCDVTSGELLAAYRADKREYGGVLLTSYQFQRELPGVIRACFGVAKRHEVLRPDPTGRLTKRNGWIGLRLNDGNDGNDGPNPKPQPEPPDERQAHE